MSSAARDDGAAVSGGTLVFDRNDARRRNGESFATWFERRADALSSLPATVADPAWVPPHFRIASVLAPFWPSDDGGVRLALTLRPTSLSSHKGQISFPGGRRDASDPDLAFTALREANEELGIAPAAVRRMVRLDDAWSVQGYLVAPHVGWLDRAPSIVPSPAEVERVIIADVEQLMRPEIHRPQVVEHGGQRWTVHYYHYEGDVIWGMTAGILSRLFRLLNAEPLLEDSVGVESLRRFVVEQGRE